MYMYICIQFCSYTCMYMYTYTACNIHVHVQVHVHKTCTSVLMLKMRCTVFDTCTCRYAKYTCTNVIFCCCTFTYMYV